MEYTITKKWQVDETVFTNIQFEYDNQTILVNSVAHFRPTDENDIEIGIVNRINTEINKIEASKNVEIVSNNLVVGTPKTASPQTQNIVDNSELSLLSDEALDQRLTALSVDYDDIVATKADCDYRLSVNSTEYDKVIAEILKRK